MNVAKFTHTLATHSSLISGVAAAMMNVAMVSVTPVRFRSAAIYGIFRALRPGTAINGGAAVPPEYGS